MTDFWSFVDKTPGHGPNEDCWLWLGTKHKSKKIQIICGRFCFYVNGKRKRIMAHRLAFKYANGHIDEDLLVCHSCDFGLCCNPAHLWQGTKKDNNSDRHKKGRTIVPCLKGENNGPAKITEEQAKEILKLYNTGRYKQKELAEMFNLTQQTISDIYCRKSWPRL